MAPLSKSSTAASAKGKATPAKAKNNNNKKKKKTKESTTPTKDNLLSPEQFNKFYDELIRLAELIPQNQQHADHVSIATILKDNKMKAVCWYILTVSSFGSNDGRRNNITLKKIIKLFKSAGCDIRPFRGGKDKDEQEKNLTAYYEKHENNISFFLTAMFVYTIRCMQGACAVCGKVIEDLLFGALGYESNHWEADKDSNDCGGEGDKCFGVNAHNFGKAFIDIMTELVKTQLECWECHNRFGPTLCKILPDKCFGVYNFLPRPYCAVQDSPEGRDLYKCTKSLLLGEVESYSFEHVVSTILGDTFFTDERDALLFDKERWESITSVVARQEMIMRFYLQAEKRLAGPCYLCKETKFSTLKSMGGGDNHHVDEDNKKLNPSECASRAKVAKKLDVKPADLGVVEWLDFARCENRKTFLLDKCCHMKVTYDDGWRKVFADMMTSDGYDVDYSDTGEIFVKP